MKLKKILAVDDDRNMLILIDNILNKDKYELITAENGTSALEKAKGELPDLIILDVQLPEIDGFRVFKELKSNPQTKDIPVIMLTGISEKRGIHFSKEEMGAFYKVEPQHYLDKPIHPDKLRKIIEKII